MRRAKEKVLGPEQLFILVYSLLLYLCFQMKISCIKGVVLEAVTGRKAGNEKVSICQGFISINNPSFDLQILGMGSKRLLTLTHRAQVKRFTQDLLKLLKSQASKQVVVREFSQAYHW